MEYTRITPDGARTPFTANAVTESSLSDGPSAIPLPRNQPTAPRGLTPGRMITSIAVSVIGVGGLAFGWSQIGRLPDDHAALAAASALDAGYLALQDDIIRRRWVAGLSVGIGSLALLVGLPLMMPRTRATRVVGWIFGAVGLGLVAASVPFLVRNRTCIDPECQQRDTPYLTGVGLITTGVPLMVLPLALLRTSGVQLDVRGQTATLRVQW